MKMTSEVVTFFISLKKYGYYIKFSNRAGSGVYNCTTVYRSEAGAKLAGFNMLHKIFDKNEGV